MTGLITIEVTIAQEYPWRVLPPTKSSVPNDKAHWQQWSAAELLSSAAIGYAKFYFLLPGANIDILMLSTCNFCYSQQQNTYVLLQLEQPNQLTRISVNF